jgi:hypothetical protein
MVTAVRIHASNMENSGFDSRPGDRFSDRIFLSSLYSHADVGLVLGLIFAFAWRYSVKLSILTASEFRTGNLRSTNHGLYHMNEHASCFVNRNLS